MLQAFFVPSPSHVSHIHYDSFVFAAALSSFTLCFYVFFIWFYFKAAQKRKNLFSFSCFILAPFIAQNFMLFITIFLKMTTDPPQLFSFHYNSRGECIWKLEKGVLRWYKRFVLLLESRRVDYITWIWKSATVLYYVCFFVKKYLHTRDSVLKSNARLQSDGWTIRTYEYLEISQYWPTTCCW